MEQCLHDGHQECRRGALAADVTDTEEQLLVTDKIVIEVAAYGAGRFQQTFQLQSVDIQLALGQHTLLYLTGHVQLSVNALLLGIHLLQLVQVLGGTPHNQSGKDKTQNHGQHQHQAHGAQPSEYLAVFQDVDEYPVRISAHVSIEDVIGVTFLTVHHEVVLLVFLYRLKLLALSGLHLFQNLPEQRGVFARQDVVAAGNQKALR